MKKKYKQKMKEDSKNQEKISENKIESGEDQEEKTSIFKSAKSLGNRNQEISALTDKLKQAESDNLYLRAEFENFKKRSLEEKYRALQYEGEKFISSLATEVLDDLERALSASQENRSLEDLQKGLEIIHKKTIKLLNRFGVEILDPTGKIFDPSYQEALSFVRDSKFPEDYVAETFKKAYKMHDKVIRPAQVIVVKKEK